MTRATTPDRRKTQVAFAATFLAFTTPTVLPIVANGQDAPSPEIQTSERYVPNPGHFAASATLEVKAESTLTGSDVLLRQVCRWAGGDAKFFAPLADLKIAHFQGDAPFQTIALEDIRRILHDSGANLGVIHFAGSTTCTVTRTDAKPGEADVLHEWIDAREGNAPAASPLETPATQPVRVMILSAPSTHPAPAETRPDDSPVHTLRALIAADASVRLRVPVDQLQLNFNPANEKMLNLAEPQFKFNIEANHVYGLGDVAWDVSIITPTETKKIPIQATARAWQMQVKLIRPVAFRQVIRADDVAQTRVLSDQSPDEPLLSLGQCIGQESARELKPGTILTAPMVNPVDLAKAGQFITVVYASGNIRVKTVARAMEAGSFGQTVQVMNETTRELYSVVLTGPQEGTVNPLPIEKKLASGAE